MPKPLFIFLLIVLSILGCKNLKEEKKSGNQPEIEAINENAYILALKDYIIKEWTLEKESNLEIDTIIFENNQLDIKSKEGYALSTYRFSDLEISKVENSKAIEIIIYNEGGGGGGNMVFLETYRVTKIASGTFQIKNTKNELLK